MGLIVTELYDALIEAGATERKARAAAAAIPLTEHLATREDLVATGRQLADRTAGLGVDLGQGIADLRTEIKEDTASLRAEVDRQITELRAEIKQEIAELRAEIKEEIAELRAEVDRKIAELRAEIKEDIAELRAEVDQKIAELRAEIKEDIAKLDKRIAVLNLGVFSFGPAILALLVKLAFFP